MKFYKFKIESTPTIGSTEPYYVHGAGEDEESAIKDAIKHHPTLLDGGPLLDFFEIDEVEFSRTAWQGKVRTEKREKWMRFREILGRERNNSVGKPQN